MRKIERQMNFALSNKADWSSSNTRVEFNDSTNCFALCVLRFDFTNLPIYYTAPIELLLTVTALFTELSLITLPNNLVPAM